MRGIYKVKLTKLQSNHNNLSLNVYTGRCLALPIVGEQFNMSTIQEGNLWTTVVKSYEKNYETGAITFKTKNSTYRLEVQK